MEETKNDSSSLSESLLKSSSSDSYTEGMNFHMPTILNLIGSLLRPSTGGGLSMSSTINIQVSPDGTWALLISHKEQAVGAPRQAVPTSMNPIRTDEDSGPGPELKS
jgi:hypothetical protein